MHFCLIPSINSKAFRHLVLRTQETAKRFAPGKYGSKANTCDKILQSCLRQSYGLQNRLNAAEQNGLLSLLILILLSALRCQNLFFRRQIALSLRTPELFAKFALPLPGQSGAAKARVGIYASVQQHGFFLVT